MQKIKNAQENIALLLIVPKY